jgi:hypothetical protein
MRTAITHTEHFVDMRKTVAFRLFDSGSRHRDAGMPDRLVAIKGAISAETRGTPTAHRATLFS